MATIASSLARPGVSCRLSAWPMIGVTNEDPWHPAPPLTADVITGHGEPPGPCVPGDRLRPHAPGAGNPCTGQSVKKPVGRIGLNRETADEDANCRVFTRHGHARELGLPGLPAAVRHGRIRRQAWQDSTSDVTGFSVKHAGFSGGSGRHALIDVRNGEPVAVSNPASHAHGSLQGVMRLALVEADIRAAPHFCIEQPFDDERRPFNPPDFAQDERQGTHPGPSRKSSGTGRIPVRNPDVSQTGISRTGGVAVTLAWDPRPDTRLGLAVLATRSWGGAPSGGVAALLGPETFPDARETDGGMGEAARVGAELRRARTGMTLGASDGGAAAGFDVTWEWQGWQAMEPGERRERRPVRIGPACRRAAACRSCTREGRVTPQETSR